MYIKIIRGNYGYTVGALVKIKTPRDAPFEVADDEALRLKKLGIAEIIEFDDDRKSDAASESENSPSGSGTPTGEDDPDRSEGEDVPENDFEDGSEDIGSESDGDGAGIPEYSAENTNAELQAIAEKFGIDVPPRAAKAQILEILDGFFGDMPVLTAKEPE